MKKTKRMLSMLLAVVTALFSVFGHAATVYAEGSEVYLDENVRLVFEIVNSWDGGYQAPLKLENLSESALNSWKIYMTSSDQIRDFGGADLHTLENVSKTAANVPVIVSADISESISGNTSGNTSEDTSEDILGG